MLCVVCNAGVDMGTKIILESITTWVGRVFGDVRSQIAPMTLLGRALMRGTSLFATSLAEKVDPRVHFGKPENKTRHRQLSFNPISPSTE